MELVTPTRCPQCNSSEFTAKPVNADWDGRNNPDFDLSKWEDDSTLVECNYCHTQFMAKGVRRSFDYRQQPAAPPVESNDLVRGAKSVLYKIIGCFFYFLAFIFGLGVVVNLFQIPSLVPEHNYATIIAAFVVMGLMAAGFFIAGRRMWRA
ncbi:hypothetical protein [Chitinophaga sp. Cy-1792]|uniref:hypothetical protein n=1 Tax=Chitinophaga sp. Cy-1792 TaxID=2608339 RepID=UPI0014224964|nr:hypothetical protein [Chitinophaga sp. Cy-1792]NIG55578.1 hypothetical protein [Chitinophaga sp. Cy-1792]